MNLELTEEQLALRDTVRRFLAEKAPVADYVRPLLGDPARPQPSPDPSSSEPRARPDVASARTGPTGPSTETPDAAWNGLAELGATGLLVPEGHGGAAMTMIEAGIVAEELGRALHPGPWLSTAVAVPRALARSGVGDAGADLLAGIAKGTTIATLAVTGPPAPQGIATRGGEALLAGEGGDVLDAVAAGTPQVASPDGEGATERPGNVVVTGDLQDVPDAAAATAMLVVAADADRDGSALFAVDMSSPGVEVTPQPGVDLTRPLFRVRLDGVPARRLGAAGPDAVQAVIDDLLVAWAADALGAAQAVFELAVDYAKVRTQFGRPIGAFQAVQHLCVDMYETVELARGGVMHALWAADAANVSAEERHLAAVRAKAFSGRLATVGDIAVQVFGGIGFTWEHDAHLYLRRLLGWSAFLGAPGPYLRELGAQVARSASTPRP